MCTEKDCGEPGNNKPWCGTCDGHTSEVSMALHQARNHQTSYPPPPPPAG